MSRFGSRKGPARPAGADLRRHHPWVVHTQGLPCWSGVARVREGWLGPHFLRVEPVIVEELTADLSVEWAWEHASQSPHEDGVGRPRGQRKEAAGGGRMCTVSPEAEEKVGVWRKGFGSPVQTGQFWVMNDQRSNTQKSRGHWVWLVRTM